MIRLKENARSADPEEAVKYLEGIIAKYPAYTRGGDIVVHKKRTASGVATYEASAWLVRAE